MRAMGRGTGLRNLGLANVAHFCKSKNDADLAQAGVDDIIV